MEKQKSHKVIENIEKEISCNIVIKDFKYFILGDGIEIETKDFATEVAETNK